MRVAFLIPCLIASCLLSNVSFAAEGNVFKERAFWKAKPSLEEVKQKLAEGNDPAELNQHAFDALTWALIERNDPAVLEFLLEQPGNDVNKLTHDGRTYIFWAAYRDNTSFMQLLLSRGAKTDIIDSHGYSLLNFAAVTGQTNPKLYDLILAHGANPSEEKNLDGANALLLLMPFLEDEQMVRYFGAHGLKITDTDKEGSNALHYAAKGGKTEMLNWLMQQGLDPAQSNEEGENALHFTAMGTRGHTNEMEAFKYLVEQGADPTQVSRTGNTPLTIYCTSDKAQVTAIEYLINKGVNPNQVSETGYNALINASARGNRVVVSLLASKVKEINHQNKLGESALAIATRYNNPEVVALLLRQGATANLKDAEGNTMLYYLAQGYKTKEAEAFELKWGLLVTAGMDPQAIQGNGNNLYHLAVNKNSKTLAQKAREMEQDIDAVNKEGITPLHLAAMKAENLEMLQMLVAKGADVKMETPFEETAYDLAKENELLNVDKAALNFLKS